MEKSHVSLETKICPACDKQHQTGSILLDRRLKESMDRETPTGFALCPEHKKDGFVCLIVCDPSKSQPSVDGTMLPQNAYRTGEVIHMKKSAAKHILNMNVSAFKFCYIDISAAEAIRKMAEEAK